MLVLFCVELLLVVLFIAGLFVCELCLDCDLVVDEACDGAANEAPVSVSDMIATIKNFFTDI